MVIEAEKIENSTDGQRFAQGREVAIRDSIEQQEKLCSTSLDCTKAYSNLSKVGLGYGPVFHNIVDARACAGCCIATLEAPDTAAIMPNNFRERLRDTLGILGLLCSSRLLSLGGWLHKF